MLASPLVSSFSTGQINLPDIQGVVHARSSSLAHTGIDATIGGRVSIDAMSRNAQADITGQFSDSTVEAKLTASAFAQPSLNFDVNIDQLDLDRLLSGQQQSGENLRKTQSSAASEQWLDLSALGERKRPRFGPDRPVESRQHQVVQCSSGHQIQLDGHPQWTPSRRN